MSQHIIHYFDSTGRSDVLKLIAEVGSVPYTFKGIKREDWPSVKPSHRYGQVPALTINADKADTTIYHTVVIARYLAQEGGLYPSDRLQATQTEEYAATVDEAISKFVPIMHIESPEKKEEELKKFSEGTVKTMLTAFSGIIEKNEGYLSKGKLTWADLVFFDFLSFAPAHGLDLSPYKTILEFKERIGQLEKVKAYNESDRNLRNRK